MKRIATIARPHKTKIMTIIVSLLMFIPSGPILAEQLKDKPLWELGLAGISGYVPDYPAAADSRLHGIALPYFVYRGEVFRFGEKGIARGRIFHNDRIDFDISLDGSFDTDSDQDSVRRGMPDLDYLFEIGPRLQIVLSKNAVNERVEFELPVRAVLSTDFSSLSGEGMVATPLLAWHKDFQDTDTRIKVSAGPIFGSEGFMDYFYEVAPRYATAQRPAFDAQSGYLGSETQIGAMKKINNYLTMFGTTKLDYYGGAANDDSPLYREDFNASVRVGLIWTPFRSEARVKE